MLLDTNFFVYKNSTREKQDLYLKLLLNFKEDYMSIKEKFFNSLSPLPEEASNILRLNLANIIFDCIEQKLDRPLIKTFLMP